MIKKGFTLAEILLTLGIIGVVADIIKVESKYVNPEIVPFFPITLPCKE